MWERCHYRTDRTETRMYTFGGGPNVINCYIYGMHGVHAPHTRTSKGIASPQRH
jgi:hypothetical protein